jgi:hypothetical protein
MFGGFLHVFVQMLERNFRFFHREILGRRIIDSSQYPLPNAAALVQRQRLVHRLDRPVIVCSRLGKKK